MEKSEAPRVLVIEDEQDFAGSIGKLLKKKFRANVVWAPDAETARNKLASDSFDLITLDYQLPDDDGLILLEEIAEMPGAPPVIMVTGHGDENIASDAFRFGASGYVQKDRRISTLLIEAVDKALLGTRLKAAEEALEHERDLLRIVTETSPAGIIMIGRDRKITFANEMAARLLETGKDELIGNDYFDIGSGGNLYDSRAKPIELAEEPASIAWETGAQMLDSVNRLHLPSGKDAWFSSNIAPLPDESGEITHLVVAFKDITDLMEHIEKMERLSKMLDGLSDAILTTDADFVVTSWNKGAERMYGFTAEEAIGRPKREMIKVENPDEFQLEDVRLQIEEQGSFRGEVVFHGKEDLPIVVDLTIWASKDDTGNTDGYIAIHRDVTERVKAEQESRQTRDYLENLIDYANAPIVVWDPEFRITLFNHAFERLSGYRASNVMGKELSMLFPDDRRAASLLKIALTSSGEFWESVEIPILRGDGEERIALWNSANIYAEDDETLIATIAQGQDFTDRMRVEEELERMNAELSGFAHGVSHDLRGPLSAMLLANECLGDAVKETDLSALRREVEEARGTFRKNLNQSFELIDDLLVLAESGQRPSSVISVNMGDLVRKIADEWSPLIKERGASLRVGDDMGTVTASQTHMYQLFSNLVSNAIEHNSNENPIVEVAYQGRDAEGMHCYTVRDNGPGIPPVDLEHIFKPFFTCDGMPGTGVGLAIVDKIVTMYSGGITAVNDNGACFRLTLRDWEPETAGR
jgi:PAS domain S-box-containing protein